MTIAFLYPLASTSSDPPNGCPGLFRASVKPGNTGAQAGRKAIIQLPPGPGSLLATGAA